MISLFLETLLFQLLAIPCSTAYLWTGLIVVPSVVKHETEIFKHFLDVGIFVLPDFFVDHFHVDRLQHQLVVVRVIFARGLLQEERDHFSACARRRTLKAQHVRERHVTAGWKVATVITTAHRLRLARSKLCRTTRANVAAGSPWPILDFSSFAALSKERARWKRWDKNKANSTSTGKAEPFAWNRWRLLQQTGSLSRAWRHFPVPGMNLYCLSKDVLALTPSSEHSSRHTSFYRSANAKLSTVWTTTTKTTMHWNSYFVNFFRCFFVVCVVTIVTDAHHVLQQVLLHSKATKIRKEDV